MLALLHTRRTHADITCTSCTRWPTINTTLALHHTSPASGFLLLRPVWIPYSQPSSVMTVCREVTRLLRKAESSDAVVVADTLPALSWRWSASHLVLISLLSLCSKQAICLSFFLFFMYIIFVYFRELFHRNMKENPQSLSTWITSNLLCGVRIGATGSSDFGPVARRSACSLAIFP